MRYWGLFAAKLGGIGAFLYGWLYLLNARWPIPMFRQYRVARFGYDLPYTLLVGVWFLAACGLVYLAWMDQRRRCRVCLRRMRMPVETGSWGSMLRLGRPRIEYICPYGHGTLKEEELQITGLANPEWKPSPDMWEELKQ